MPFCAVFRYFAALDDAAVEELCGYLHPVELKGGSSLFRVGDSGDAMYIIESGRIRITVTDADGREVILASLGHGDFFGEMAMFDGHGRSADATVTEDSRLAVLTRENFLTFVSSDCAHRPGNAECDHTAVAPDR